MAIPERFKLKVSLTLEKELWSGPITSDGEPDIRNPVRGYWRNNDMNERLTINEELNLGALDFIGAMGVLGKLHEAVSELKK